MFRLRSFGASIKLLVLSQSLNVAVYVLSALGVSSGSSRGSCIGTDGSGFPAAGVPTSEAGVRITRLGGGGGAGVFVNGTGSGFPTAVPTCAAGVSTTFGVGSGFATALTSAPLFGCREDHLEWQRLV